MLTARTPLFTSLTRAKQILMATRDWRGAGAPPPPVAMTPVPEHLHDRIDPAFTIGMGALRECGDPDGYGCPECGRGQPCRARGLQCPVRGCGSWHHALGCHWTRTHAGLGGMEGIRRMLGIPHTTGLTTTAVKAKNRAKMLAHIEAGRIRPAENGVRLNDLARPSASARSRVVQSVGARNLRGTCEAQIRQRLLLVADRVGRSPGIREAELIDAGLVDAAQRLYGSWNNAKAQVGLPLDGRGRSGGKSRVVTRDTVICALTEWVRVHGRLPTYDQARRRDRLPLMPCHSVVRTHLGGGTWAEAMEVAERLVAVPRDAQRAA